MINKNYLHALGFTGFEPLTKSGRDGKDRLVWNGSLYNIGVMIMLVYNISSWEVEKIIVDDNEQTEELEGHFSTNPTIEEIVESISVHGMLGGISP
ncbi:hypothetical protein SAMN04488055_1577 [Chitinophaga niabensis]|uniref:Uncharacterized protein n=2 Tax=Chitinophaga niabensis TaxID=536979 RepID=A0A1N6EG08_9BACT|nr:hypothetical protein SAMN04488055_1577 [Chitinophaga niabensis]